jgi:hypothetical protein
MNELEEGEIPQAQQPNKKRELSSENKENSSQEVNTSKSPSDQMIVFELDIEDDQHTPTQKTQQNHDHPSEQITESSLIFHIITLDFYTHHFICTHYITILHYYIITGNVNSFVLQRLHQSNLFCHENGRKSNVFSDHLSINNFKKIADCRLSNDVNLNLMFIVLDLFLLLFQNMFLLFNSPI